MRAEERLARLGVAPVPRGPDPDRAGLLVAAVLLAVGWGVAGPLVGALSALVGSVVVRLLVARLPPPGERARLSAVEAQLPLGLELLAAALSAGVTPREAAVQVSVALRGPFGEALGRVDADWSSVAGLGHPVTAKLAAAVARSASSGAPLEPWVSGLAADLRAQAGPRAEAAARSAGAWAVLPLGLCFLPAYLLLGVVPCLLGLAKSLPGR